MGPDSDRHRKFRHDAAAGLIEAAGAQILNVAEKMQLLAIASFFIVEINISCLRFVVPREKKGVPALNVE